MKPAYPGTILVELTDAPTPLSTTAVDRLRAYCSGAFEVCAPTDPAPKRAEHDLVVVLGSAAATASLRDAWGASPPSDGDAFIVKSVSDSPTTIAASGIGPRGTLFAAYCLAELFETGADLTAIDIRRVPTVPQRAAMLSASFHGGEQFIPQRFYDWLHEMPRYGLNTVMLCPGGQVSVPFDRHAGVPFDYADGVASVNNAKLPQWRDLLAEIKAYGFDVLLTWPCLQAPEGDLFEYHRLLLTAVLDHMPEFDGIVFCPTEGADWGPTNRLFVIAGHTLPPEDEEMAWVDAYDKEFRQYLDALCGVCDPRDKSIAFWTHSAGITSAGLRRMREVLFDYPQVLNLEDDYFPNVGWVNFPFFGYLPDDMRDTIQEKNPLGVYLITADAEFYGAGGIPTAYPDPMVHAAREAVVRGAQMVMMRLDMHDRTEMGQLRNMNEIIPLAAAAQMWNPAPDLDELWHAWTQRRFGAKAAPHMLKALRSSDEIIRKGYLVGEMNLMWASSIVAGPWSPGYFPTESRFEMFGKPGRALAERASDERLSHWDYMDVQAPRVSVPIDAFRRNQDQAMTLMEEGLQEIQAAKPHLSDVDYAYFSEAFRDGRSCLQVFRVLGEAAYAAHIVRDNFDNLGDPQAHCTTALAALREQADWIEGNRPRLFGGTEGSIASPPVHGQIRKIAEAYEAYVAGQSVEIVSEYEALLANLEKKQR